MNEDPQVVLFCVVAEFLVSYNFRHFEWMEEGDKLRCQLFRNGSALTIFSPTGTQLAVQLDTQQARVVFKKTTSCLPSLVLEKPSYLGVQVWTKLRVYLPLQTSKRRRQTEPCP